MAAKSYAPDTCNANAAPETIKFATLKGAPSESEILMAKTAARKQSNNQGKSSPSRQKAKSASNDELDMQPVESNALEAIGYMQDTNDLYVTFKETGETYHYSLVPRQVFEELLAAESKGKFFEKWVRQKPYPYEKVA